MKVLITPRSFGKTDSGLFERLEKAGLELVRNETGAILSQDAMCELIEPCEGVILGVDPLDAQVLEHAPRLRAVSKYGVGVDNIDLAECERRGIRVSRTVGANSNAVADYAMALMLGVARRVCEIDRLCRKRDWSKITSLDMFGKTLGIIGLGAIGKCVCRRARGFEIRILAHDTHWDSEFASQYDVVRANPDKICREADFISLHCVLNDETRQIINRQRIGMMKETAIIVNTARGELIEEDALLDALKNKRIYGAGIDVFCQEPPQNPEWYELDNIILGSHCSSSSKGATEMMGALAVDNLLRDLGISW